MITCRICNRVLKNPKWAALGIGPICASRQAIAEARDDEQPLLLNAAVLQDVGLVCERLADGRLACNIPQIFKWHSPTGFECGYGGSGPADLALNVLAILIPNGSDGAEGWRIWDGQTVSATAGLLHQTFKDDFIAGMDRAGGKIAIEDIRAWIAEQRAEASFSELLSAYLPLEAS